MGAGGPLGGEDKEKVSFQIKEIAEHIQNGDYQYDFFTSLQDQYEEKGWLSPKQVDALDRIYCRVTA